MKSLKQSEYFSCLWWAGGVEYTDCIGVSPSPPKSVLISSSIAGDLGIAEYPIAGPLWSGLVTHNRVISISKIEQIHIQTEFKQMNCV